jgi:histidinol-phosphate aminotransferase
MRRESRRFDNLELMMSRPVPKPGILDIAPYTPGKSPVPEAGRKVFKLSANETPFGPSPHAIEVYKAAAAHLEDYPEGTSRVLREAIGRAFGLDPDRIICGAGSDEILNLLAHVYLGPGDEAISTTHGFLVYPIATMANGASNVVAPETNFTCDVDAILKLVSPRTKLVWLANPNNPTGTYLPFDEVKRLRVGLPPDVLLVIDAAYSDYVSRNDYELGIELVATTDNTVVTHTFSKIHGLAALRVGWMFGPVHIVDAVNRIRGPFNVSTPAMLAAAAALEDSAHIQMSKTHTEHWRNWLTEEISRLGLDVTPSVANFILIHFPTAKGRTAADADAFLTKRGLVLRALNNYKLPHALRMTIGTEEANRLVAEALRDFMAQK